MREKLIRWTPANVARLQELTDRGFTAQESADRMGVTKQSIEKAAQKFGISTPRKPRRADKRCDKSWSFVLSMPRPKAALNG